jgi:hypothetical protein
LSLSSSSFPSFSHFSPIPPNPPYSLEPNPGIFFSYKEYSCVRCISFPQWFLEEVLSMWLVISYFDSWSKIPFSFAFSWAVSTCYPEEWSAWKSDSQNTEGIRIAGNRLDLDSVKISLLVRVEKWW